MNSVFYALSLVSNNFYEVRSFYFKTNDFFPVAPQAIYARPRYPAQNSFYLNRRGFSPSILQSIHTAPGHT